MDPTVSNESSQVGWYWIFNCDHFLPLLLLHHLTPTVKIMVKKQQLYSKKKKKTVATF